MLPVPQFEFGSFKYAAGLVSYNNYWQWSGPSQAIQSMASRVMAAGQVLPVTPPAPNATWTIDFWGPALQCNDVPKTKSDQIFTNIWNSYDIDDPGDPASYSFLSWVPWSPNDYGENANFSGNSSNLAPCLPFIFDFIQIYSSSFYGGTSIIPKMGPPSSPVSTGGPLSLLIAVLPGTQNVSIRKVYPGPNVNGDMQAHKDIVYSPNAQISGLCDYRTIRHITDTFINCTNAPENILAIALENATLPQCDLVNTSYFSEFEYSNGQQVIRLRPNTTGSPPVVNGSAYFVGPKIDTPESTNCGSLRVGEPADASVDEAPDVWKDCDFVLSALRLLSYQGIMAAFNQLIVGCFQRKYDRNIINLETNTTIMRTVLADTAELAFMRNWISSPATSYFPGGTDNLQTLVANSTAKTFQGLTGENMLGTRGALKTTLEELFRNYTISLLADPYFQPNYSSAFAPPQLANVSLPTYQTVYTYNQVTLWIAYGVSILFSALAAIAGIVAIILSGASYSNQFSTIVRVAKTGDLDVNLVDRKSDGFGRDPLPDYLEHAHFDMWGNGGDGDHDNSQARDGKKDTTT